MASWLELLTGFAPDYALKGLTTDGTPCAQVARVADTSGQGAFAGEARQCLSLRWLGGKPLRWRQAREAGKPGGYQALTEPGKGRRTPGRTRMPGRSVKMTLQAQQTNARKDQRQEQKQTSAAFPGS